ncbi:hypothetical protein [Acinetobacter soli]|uniref:hypothetical protein n=1 Tax=Acinetobacter soli TaxID=487316 RepID=UPI001D0A154D|nr:hypothetical protein [Acinetobacter soli]MCB8769536.1 hypothetical protein [Acinetobacter soli]
MNAHKFVAEKGVDEAKRVLDKYKDCYMPSVFKYWSEKMSDFVLAPKYASCKVSELKQVVESLDTIDRLFGLHHAKHTMGIFKKIGCTSDYEQIKQAIADYELVESYKQVKVEVSFGIGLQSNQSIGAKCEVLDMVDVSPNCEVINETH